MSRDYTAEFAAGLIESVPDGEFVPAIVASNYIARLADTDPALLNGWLVANAAAFATDLLGCRLRNSRAKARAHASAREFAANVADPDYAGSFTITYRIADDDTRIRVADMTGDHHRFVASDYEASARTDRMLAAFHRAIAKKVGKARTADVISEGEYDALYRSLTRAPAVGAA